MARARAVETLVVNMDLNSSLYSTPVASDQSVVLGCRVMSGTGRSYEYWPQPLHTRLCKTEPRCESHNVELIIA